MAALPTWLNAFLTSINPSAVVLYGTDGTVLRPVLVGADGSLVGGVQQGSLTERSGSMTTGGTSKQMMAANASRKYLIIHNPSTIAGQNIAALEPLFIRFGAVAAGVNNGTAFELGSGGYFIQENAFVGTDAIQVNAATTSHRWIAAEG